MLCEMVDWKLSFGERKRRRTRSLLPPLFAIHGQIVALAVTYDCVVEQLLVGVETAHFEIVRGKLGADAEFDIGEVGGTGLRIGACGLDAAAYERFPRDRAPMMPGPGSKEIAIG